MARTGVADSLTEYRRKRDFSKTTEPEGGTAPADEYTYVIQKHAARRLHYDLRLALDGVLKSWAVTRGPSLDPSEKRLAVRTEDHPLKYGGFEGTIAPGEYGAGTVMLWDRGTWEPIGDPHEGLEKGDLKFRLHGERLKGTWVLVRLKPRDGEKRENWLLIKKRDKHADDGRDVLDRHTKSVATGRTMKQIAKGDAVWHSDRPAGGADGSASEARARVARRTGSRVPKPVAPQLATLVDEAPEGEDWLHEIKYDGYRIVAATGGGDAVLQTRKGEDWTARFRGLVPDLVALPVGSALIDGEVVVLDDAGRSRFGDLQRALKDRHDTYTYVAFDLLSVDGEDLRRQPLETRKERLRDIMSGAGGRLLYCDHVIGNGPAVLSQACAMGLEGIVSKRRDSRYRSGRSRNWLKIKCNGHDDFIIGGWRPSTVAGRPFASLLVGEPVDGKLVYRGRVGTGFDSRDLAELGKKLRTLEIKAPPFDTLPREARRDARWVKPELVAEIGYTETTADGLLRQPRYLGLRADKPASGSPPGEADSNGSKPMEVRVAGVHISSPDKVLFPEQGLTKRQLAEYLDQVADVMLPHAAMRPLTLLRCPEGRARKCFYQKHGGPGVTDAFQTIEIEEAKGTRADYLYIKDRRGLVGTAQMGVLELHLWGARVDRLDRPDRLVFDLDPDEAVPFAEVRRAAADVAELLEAAGIRSFPLLTGGKGVHVVAPLARRQGWPEIKAFAAGLARSLSAADPDRFLAKASKAARKGKIFIDWLRNERGASAIAPYSVRARPGAPVAVPVGWQELPRMESSARYSMDAALRRVSGLKRDPWEDYFEIRQSIGARTLELVRKAL